MDQEAVKDLALQVDLPEDLLAGVAEAVAWHQHQHHLHLHHHNPKDIVCKEAAGVEASLEFTQLIQGQSDLVCINSCTSGQNGDLVFGHGSHLSAADLLPVSVGTDAAGFTLAWTLAKLIRFIAIKNNRLMAAVFM